jgi:hypothetical protein
MVDTINDPDRDRGVLTPADRRYLLGEADIEPKSTIERQTRERIRNRLANSVLDLALLYAHLEDRDLRQVFAADLEEHDASDDPDADRVVEASTPSERVALRHAAALVLRIYDVDNTQAFPRLDVFSDELAAGIEHYLADYKGLSADVTVDMTLDDVGPADRPDHFGDLQESRAEAFGDPSDDSEE